MLQLLHHKAQLHSWRWSTSSSSAQPFPGQIGHPKPYEILNDDQHLEPNEAALQHCHLFGEKYQILMRRRHPLNSMLTEKFIF